MEKYGWLHTPDKTNSNTVKIIATTERLILREQMEQDAPFILELMNTEGWLKNIGYRNVHTVDDAAAYIREKAIKSYEEHGLGFYLVTLKDGNTPLGICGLARRPTLEHIDIGFAFLPQYERKGYGLESATAVMHHARHNLQLPAICAITIPANTPSIRLIEKLGLTFSKIITSPDDEDLMLFEIALV